MYLRVGGWGAATPALALTHLALFPLCCKILEKFLDRRDSEYSLQMIGVCTPGLCLLSPVRTTLCLHPPLCSPSPPLPSPPRPLPFQPYRVRILGGRLDSGSDQTMWHKPSSQQPQASTLSP